MIEDFKIPTTIIQPYGLVEFNFDKDKREWKKTTTYFKVKYEAVQDD